MGIFYKGLLLASLLVVQVLAAYPRREDPCSFTVGQEVFTVEEILNCYESIPVKTSRIESTLASLHELIQTYSFTDIAMSNISPYNVNVDLASELVQISQTNFTGDYAFHMALSRLFNKLNDAHTMYYAPEPYRECSGITAFALTPGNAAALGKDVPIFLRANPLASKKSVDWNWPIDPDSFNGRQVVQINGQDPRDYLMKYADHVGTYKDQIVRFNHLFDLTGWGMIDSYTFPMSDIPKEIITVVSSNGGLVNVTVPVKMYCYLITYTNTEDFIDKIDAFARPTNKRSIEMPSLTPDLRKERLRRIQHLIEPREAPVNYEMDNLSVVQQFELVVRKLQAKRSTERNGILSVVRSLSDNSMHLLAYQDEEGNIGPVLKVESFATESPWSWTNLAINFNLILYKFNFTYAVVDVNKNGGGIICLTLLLQSLMDERIASVDVNHTDVLWTPYNMRKTSFFDKVYNAGLEEMDNEYLDMQTGKSDDPKTFYNAETHNISLPNDVRSELTKFTYFPGTCKRDIAQGLKLVRAWPKNLIVTTDGSCGSACAVFMAKMTKLGSATIVAVGGDTKKTNVTMRTASFPGGNVVSWSDMGRSTNLTTPFTTSAIARFNWHQAFSSASYNEYPLEYNYAAFEPTMTLRSWSMVVNDDITTDEGLNNLVETYSAAMKVWGDFVQTMPVVSPFPSSLPVSNDSPVAGPSNSPNPISHGPSSSPSESTHGSSSSTTYVPVYVVVIVAGFALLAVILAIVFGVKYSQMKKVTRVVLAYCLMLTRGISISLLLSYRFRKEIYNNDPDS